MSKANVQESSVDIAAVVKDERKSLRAAFKRASKSKKTVKAFLVRAGILDKAGELAKSYR